MTGNRPSIWWRIGDRLDYAFTYARLAILDSLAPMPETPVDRAIREEGERERERLRRAFPKVDIDGAGPAPGHHVEPEMGRM